jgi:hypothetical protein
MAERGVIKEFRIFLKGNKKLWLIPIALVLLLIGLVLALSQSRAIAPFIYSSGLGLLSVVV